MIEGQPLGRFLDLDDDRTSGKSPLGIPDVLKEWPPQKNDEIGPSSALRICAASGGSD